MGAESNIRRRVLALLRPLDACAVENRADPGTPDVNCVVGWIELKQVPRWPARASTPLRVPTFTSQQRAWLRDRRAAGGGAWVLLRVGTDWLLLQGEVAAAHLGTTTKAQLTAVAVAYWPAHLNTEELLLCLTRARRS